MPVYLKPIHVSFFSELKDKVSKAEQHVEQYKTISLAVEQSLKEQNEASQTFKDTMEKRLKEAHSGWWGMV